MNTILLNADSEVLMEEAVPQAGSTAIELEAAANESSDHISGSDLRTSSAGPRALDSPQNATKQGSKQGK